MSASKTENPSNSNDRAAEMNSLEIERLGYEQAFKTLEQLVASMESGQLSLEEALDAYKRGNMLLEHCQKSLAAVEQQVKILNERQQLTTFNSGDE